MIPNALLLLAGIGPFAAVMVAAGGADNSNGWGIFLNLGVLGAVFILLLTKRLALYTQVEEARRETERAWTESRKQVDEARADALAAREEVRQVRDTLNAELVPALTRILDASTRMTEVLTRQP